MKKTTTLKKEVIRAYADCNRDCDRGAKIRNLHYYAHQPVNKETAIEIMTAALGCEVPEEAGYNSFCPVLLDNLPDDSKIWLAREGSVCVYVETAAKISETRLMKKMNADEVDVWNDDRIRIWWD